MKPLQHAIALALGAALLVAPGPTPAALDQAQYVALGASVLRIEAPRRQGGWAFGSAVAVAPDQVVTNCHVVRDALRVDVMRIGLRWPAAGLAAALGRDLCLLQVPGLNAAPVAVGRADALAAGQPVNALGYTGGIGLQNVPGEVVRLHPHDGSAVIQSNNGFSSGASGGGLFDDQGQLVGVLTFRLRGGPAHYFAAPAEWVSQLMADAARDGFSAVGPLPAQPLAYWQETGPRQPPFLQTEAAQRAPAQPTHLNRGAADPANSGRGP